MKRRTFDLLSVGVGALLTLVLLVGGILLIVGASWGLGQVHDNLSAQKIVFPAANSAAITALPAADAAAMRQYAGQEMTTGAQAETYADHFIGVHVTEVAAGRTYAEVSNELQSDEAALKANPANQALQTRVTAEKSQQQTLFQGQTLRGLLLEAYGFSVFAAIALWAGVAALVGAAVMLVLVILGLVHWSRTPGSATV